MSLKESLGEKLKQLAEADFNYIETKDVRTATQLDYGASGLYMEATIVYFEVKNLPYVLKEHGRRKAAQAYTLFHEALVGMTQGENTFVNCYSPSSFLIVFPGREETIKAAVVFAMKVAQALSEDFKYQFSAIPGLEFAMGLDHGHIMGTKNLSDGGLDDMTWFGACINKAIRICKECSRPFYVGVSGSIYHSLDDDMRIAQRRILGIKKNVEIWSKVSYQYENVKKHLYQTNHKISLDEA